jgi:hypothetical protein
MHLILWESREELAVKVSSHNETSCCLWILGSNDIDKSLAPVRCFVFKRILFDVPFECFQSRDQIILDKCIVVSLS